MHTHDSTQLPTYLVQVTDTTDQRAALKLKAAFAHHGGRLGLRADIIDIAPANNTLDIGVIVSEQLHNSQRPDRLIIGVNCAPPDKREGTTDNARNDFFFAELKNNVIVGGTSNGLELSYVRDQIERLYRLTTTNSLKSQFRSLEILPENLVRFSLSVERQKLIESGVLIDETNNIDSIVPYVPDVTHVIEVDNFGNVKLLPSRADRDLLGRVQDTSFGFGSESVEYRQEKPSNVLEFRALVRPTLFAAPLGTNIIALSSSSRILGGQTVPMIATVRERPAETPPGYQRPHVGNPVILRPAA